MTHLQASAKPEKSHRSLLPALPNFINQSQNGNLKKVKRTITEAYKVNFFEKVFLFGKNEIGSFETNQSERTRRIGVKKDKFTFFDLDFLKNRAHFSENGQKWQIESIFGLSD